MRSKNFGLDGVQAMARLPNQLPTRSLYGDNTTGNLHWALYNRALLKVGLPIQDRDKKSIIQSSIVESSSYRLHDCHAG